MHEEQSSNFAGSRFEDEYSTKWANAFDEAGKVLLKMSAADLDNIKQSPELTTKLQPLQYHWPREF